MKRTPPHLIACLLLTATAPLYLPTSNLPPNPAFGTVTAPL